MPSKKIAKKRPLKKAQELTIPAKANYALNVILIIMAIIVFRVWHLTVIQHETRIDAARKPQRRTIISPAERGTIRDRFNIPLAINTTQYNATVFYAPIREIPRIVHKKNKSGVVVKHYTRKEHISALAKILATELDLDAERIEDLIHAKAALLPNAPFVIKEDISERQYFRLKMLEKDWLGLHAARVPKRFYPQECVASDVIGYMGAISREEYNSVINEIRKLEGYLSDEEQELSPDLPEGYQSAEEIVLRLKTLEERAYTINDYVGKTGVENSYDEQLRGFRGKKSYYSDARGAFLRELAGARDPLPGQRLLLTISSELQEYAETLLAQNEKIREGKSIHYDFNEHTRQPLKQPWIKGGAIVAMDPITGEVLALASYPRYNPNDFIPSGNSDIASQKRSHIYRWLESERHIAEIWDRKVPLEREVFSPATGSIEEEQTYLTWEIFLSQILPRNNKARDIVVRKGTISNAVSLQRAMNALLSVAESHNACDIINALYNENGHISYHDQLSASDRDILNTRLLGAQSAVSEIRTILDPFFRDVKYNYDKLLILDLFAIAAHENLFSRDLVNLIGNQNLSEYRDISAHLAVVEDAVHSMAKKLFHTTDFSAWLNDNKESFLKKKRLEESAAKHYHVPYIDLLDKQESLLFNSFWEHNRWDFIAAFLLGPHYSDKPGTDSNSYIDHFISWERELENGAHSAARWFQEYSTLKKILKPLPPSLAVEYLKSMRSYNDLSLPLYGKYPHLRHINGIQLEKHLASAFYPIYGYGYGRSHAFRQAAPLGSIFKIVTAYAALMKRHSELAIKHSLQDLNPLTIIDQPHKQAGSNSWNVGYTPSWKPIEQRYKGGRLPRSARQDIGKIDIYSAIETSSNPYFSMLAGDLLDDPEDLNRAARQLSFGERTGIDIPGEIAGRLPTDLATNKTGLYAHAIGQHSLVVTPLQTAVMFSAIANGGHIVKPKIVKIIAGEEPVRSEETKNSDQYTQSLSLIGIDFPLFSTETVQKQKKLVQYIESETLRDIPLPDEVRTILLEATNRVLTGSQGCANINRIHNYYDNLDALTALKTLKNSMCGKTSTAEKIENVSLDIATGTYIYKHLWFGSIVFESDSSQDEKTSLIFFDRFGKPELVVVVYLRFGDFGREAAPLAAQIVQKWREIKKNAS